MTLLHTQIPNLQPLLPYPFITTCLPSFIRLEALLGDLSLGSSNGSSSVGVDEATAGLSVLEGGSLGRADTLAGGGDLGAASAGAVGIVDTSTGDELSTVTGTDVLGAGVIGGKGHGGGGD